MPTRSQPNETFEYNTGLPNQAPGDLRAFKDQVDAAIGAGGVVGIRVLDSAHITIPTIDATDVGLVVRNINTTAGNISALAFSNANGYQVHIGSQHIGPGATAGGDFFIATREAGAANLGEALRVFSDKTVRIGTAGIAASTGYIGAPVPTLFTINNNTVTPQSTANAVGEIWTLHVVQPDGQSGGMGIDAYGTGNLAAFSMFDFRRANGTAAAPSALQSGDLIGVIGWLGYAATGYSGGAAQIRGFANGNWTDTSNPSRIAILTCAIGQTGWPGGPTERISISDAGIGLGVAIPNAKFEVRDGTVILSTTGLDHGITNLAPTTAFVKLYPFDSSGGVQLLGVRSDALGPAVKIQGLSVGNITSAFNASIQLQGSIRSGAGPGQEAVGAAGKVLTVLNFATELFTIYGNGNTTIASTGRLQSSNYASQTTGWGITGAGDADFRYVYADQLHAKSFIADLEQALAGGQIISKSVAELNADFTLPAAGGAGTLVIKDLPSASGMAVFVSGDIVRLRQFSRAAGALTIADAWGVVTSFVDNGNGTQNWTFTRSTGARAGTATGTINGKTLALDYGTTGNGFHEVNAIDGAYGVNSPYSQIVTWATHPQDGQTIRTRTGNLKGITTTTEFGLYAGDGGITNANKYLRISDQNFEIHNIKLNLYEDSVLTISLDPAVPSLAIGSPIPTAYLTGGVTSGIWMGNAGASVYKMRVGRSDGAALTAGFTWDGTVLNVIGSGTFSGTVTATAGAIGGWSITSTDIRNAAATVMLRGAGNLAFGATPPTSASSGTGLFGDATGWTGLLANVVQAKFDAATGAITFGAGAGKLDATGINIAVGSTSSQRISWVDGADTSAAYLAVDNISTYRAFALATNVAGTKDGGTIDITTYNSGAKYATLALVSQTTPDRQYAQIFGGPSDPSTFLGLIVGSNGQLPTATLDVRGNIITAGSQTTATANKGTIEVTNTLTNNASGQSAFRARNIFNGSGNSPTGLDIAPTFSPSASIALARGVVFGAFFSPGSGVTITDVYAGNTVNVYGNTAGAITNAASFLVDSPIALGSLLPTNQYGLRVKNQGLSGMTTAIGLEVAAQSGATNNYDMSFGADDTTAAGAYYGRIPVLYKGALKYVHVFSA